MIESLLIPMAEPSRARVCGRSLTRVAGSNPARHMLCVLYSKGPNAKSGHSEQRSTDKVHRTKKKSGLREGYESDRFAGLKVSIPPGAWIFCCLLYSKDKRRNPGQSGQNSTDKLQR